MQHERHASGERRLKTVELDATGGDDGTAGTDDSEVAVAAAPVPEPAPAPAPVYDDYSDDGYASDARRPTPRAGRR